MRKIQPKLFCALFFIHVSTTGLPAWSDETSSSSSSSNESASQSSSSSSSSSTSSSVQTTLPGSEQQQSTVNVVTGTQSEPDGSTVVKVFAPKFRQRLTNLKDQINLGSSKGWLSSEQIASFNQRHDQVSAFEESVRQKGYQKDDVDKLEQQVTALNDALSQALVAGSNSKKPEVKPTIGSPVEQGKTELQPANSNMSVNTGEKAPGKTEAKPAAKPKQSNTNRQKHTIIKEKPRAKGTK